MSTAQTEAAQTIKFSPLEWQDRLYVAALCRLMSLHRMGDAANQAVVLRCSDSSQHFITHRLGAFFDDVRASDLIRCDFDGVEVDTGRKLPFGKIGVFSPIACATLTQKPFSVE